MALLVIAFLLSLVRIRIGGDARHAAAGRRRRDRGAARAQGREPAVHPDRHAARRSPLGLRLRARDQPAARRARLTRRALRDTTLAVVVDQVLDGFAVDRHAPGADAHHALRSGDLPRPRSCRPRSCARRASAPPACGATAGWRRPSASVRASRSTTGRSAARPAADRAPREPDRAGGRHRRGRHRRGRSSSCASRAATERWFLYLHLMDVHEYTYDEASARFGTTYSDVYDNAVLHVNLRARRPVRRAGRARPARSHADRHRRGPRRGVRRARRRGARAQRLPRGDRGPLDPELPVPARAGPRDRVAHQQRRRLADAARSARTAAAPGQPTAARACRRSWLRRAASAAPADDGPAYAHLDQRWGQRDTQPAPTVAVVDGDSASSRPRSRARARARSCSTTAADARERRDRPAPRRPEQAGRACASSPHATWQNAPAPWAKQTRHARARRAAAQPAARARLRGSLKRGWPRAHAALGATFAQPLRARLVGR